MRDPVFFGMVVPVGWAGYWLAGETPPASAPRGPATLSHPGMGGMTGSADLDRRLAVAFCRNRMFNTIDIAEDSATLIGDTIRHALEQRA